MILDKKYTFNAESSENMIIHGDNPDFIVMPNSGYVVMIETKGEHLTSNDDSREKAE